MTTKGDQDHGMDDQQSVSLLIHQYLAGELEEAELEAFELAMLEDANLYHEVRMTELLGKGLARESAYLGESGFRRWLRSGYSQAAIVLVAISTLAVGFFGPGEKEDYPAVNEIVLESFRGSDSVPIARHGVPIAVRAYPGPKQDGSYRVRVVGPGEVRDFASVVQQYDGSLLIILNGLEVGTHRVFIHGLDSYQSEYEFRIAD